jgi:uncharacterized protein
MSAETQNQINEAIEILTMIAEDSSVPKNIRKAATKSVENLQDQSMDLPVRAINALELLEETTSDPNCPYHIRSLLYSAITRLEIPVNE